MMLRLLQWCSWFFFLLGCGLMVSAAYHYFAPPPGYALDAGATDLELNDCVCGENREVVFRLENRSGRPIRVLGRSRC